jgi:hypothetical protein
MWSLAVASSTGYHQIGDLEARHTRIVRVHIDSGTGDRRLCMARCAPKRLSGAGRLLVKINANKEIRKRTDTNVVFSSEYSTVSIFHREREVY